MVTLNAQRKRQKCRTFLAHFQQLSDDRFVRIRGNRVMPGELITFNTSFVLLKDPVKNTGGRLLGSESILFVVGVEELFMGDVDDWSYKIVAIPVLHSKFGRGYIRIAVQNLTTKSWSESNIVHINQMNGSYPTHDMVR